MDRADVTQKPKRKLTLAGVTVIFIGITALATVAQAITGFIPGLPGPSGGGSGSVTPPTAASSSPSTASTTATSTAPGGGGSAVIYHEGILRLAFTGCADLDAPHSDSQWGEPGNPDAGPSDICSEYPSFVGVNSATLVTVSSGTNSTCQNATGWLPVNIYQDLHLSTGSFVCVHTNLGRYSLLRVVAIDSTTDSIVFSVKTFKKPGD